MVKNYKIWHKQKIEIHEEKIRVFFHEREIWFTSLGANIGFEQDGRGDKYLRPVIILKKFNNEILLCIPLTKNNKKGKYYFSFMLSNNTSTAILSQIRLIDSKRLQYKVGNINKEDFFKIKEKLRQLIA
jgi:mRNA interferase MazF